MPYGYISWSAAVNALAARLQDPNLVYWNQPSELSNCIAESLRFFNALTGWYKQKVGFTTLAGVPFYSLSSLPGFAYTVTDIEIANNVLAALLEPPLVPNWVGTGQFTFGQLLSATQNRLNRFLSEAGVVVTRSVVSGPTPPTDIVTLADTVYDVRRAGWQPVIYPPPSFSPTYPLGRMDEWAEQAYVPGSQQNPDQPISYSVFGVAPLQIRTVPTAANEGLLDLLVVQSGPTVALNPSAPIVLGIPDDLSPALKWGVLADLLGSDGPSRDYARAAYCEQRYAEFVRIAPVYPSVIAADIDNITCGLGSVADLDAYMPDWQQQIAQPAFVGVCGRDMIAVGPTPDDGTAGGNVANNYGVGLAAVAAAPVGNAQPVQIGRDWLDPVLDYAQHVASFKMGGAEFDGTTRLYQNLIAAAKAQNGRLDAVAFYRSQLQQPSMKDELEIARMVR